MAKGKKKSSGVFRIAMLLVVALFFYALYRTFGPNTGEMVKGEYLYIRTGSDYESLKKELESGGYVSDMFSFDQLAMLRKLPEHVHAGKYRINKGMSNFNIVRMLRNGRQTSVKLTINKLRTKSDLIKLLSSNLEPDSATFTALINNEEYTDKFGLDSNTIMCAVLPDTYEFFWNASADNAFRNIEKNYKKFWNEARKTLAQNQDLTPVEATIIASLVDEETNVLEDKPKIASVYLNRVRKGMKLQADPTVKFAIGDFTIRRVTGKMLQTESPYNTYMYAGLPPGPICTPSLSSLQAVLEAPKTTYLYFCANADFSGHSSFATTFDEQIKNARAYQKALDARGIH